ncbi:denticleless protein homolog [Trichonephila clavata]|uniref:Denticleless protein homolog n=1 Tax=Trichonephila clavata TaxID=2740835 RepID=A0A8X6FB01_TRICU|nr:denticleless protein homolog [Trichonephila clavata]
MQPFSFLNERQFGSSQKWGASSTHHKLNLDGLLSKLVCRRKDAYGSSEREYSVPPFACKFQKNTDSDLLAVANEDGDILLFDTEYDKGLVKSFNAHQNAIFDICWLPKNPCLVTAAGDFKCSLYDMNCCKLISSYTGHTGTVKTVDVCYEQSEMIATGSRDGNINIWDRREKYTHCAKSSDSPSISIHSAHKPPVAKEKKNNYVVSNSSKTVTSVAFQDVNHLVSVGVTDGCLKVWDLRKTYVYKAGRCHMPRYQIPYCKNNAQGCTSIVFDSSYKKLYACSTANKLYQFDLHSYSNEIVTYPGLRCNSYYVKLAISPDDQYLLSGSSCNKAYIWKVSKPGLPVFQLPAHSAEVTSVTWSHNNVTKIVTCGDDEKVLVWKLKNSDEKVEMNEIFGAAESYVKEDTVYYSPISNDDILHIVTNVRLGTPCNKTFCSTKLDTASHTKSITSFFSPMSQSLTQTCTKDSLQDSTPNLPSPSTSSASVTPVVSTESRSPCKLRNDVVPVEISPSPTKSTPPGKENSVIKMMSLNPSDKTKHCGQLKRKVSDVSSSNICRLHPRGCGKTRGHSKCGKKIISPSTPNIKKYFSTLSEK